MTSSFVFASVFFGSVGLALTNDRGAQATAIGCVLAAIACGIATGAAVSP
jgi:hypothetical protein